MTWRLKAALLAASLIVATAPASAQALVGRAENGARINAMCIGCHGIEGYRASFPQVYHVPMIAGQNLKYLSAALEAYRKGERKHPTMRGVAGSLSDQDIADLAAYYATLGKPPATEPPATVALPADLKDKLAACTACHGANFNNTVDASYPRLAGQHRDYLYQALKAYQTQNHALVGRGNAIMVGMAATLDDAQARAIADYLSGLPGDLRTAPQSMLH